MAVGPNVARLGRTCGHVVWWRYRCSINIMEFLGQLVRELVRELVLVLAVLYVKAHTCSRYECVRLYVRLQDGWVGGSVVVGWMAG